MSFIICENLVLQYPIFDIDARSFKKNLVNLATGGLINKDSQSKITVNALNNISFALKKGDRLGLIGHNGAGKSTLLRTLSGVYHPSQGNIEIDGKIASLINVSVGMEPHLTGYENIRMRGLLLGLSKEKIEVLRKNVEEFTELGDFLSMPIKTYSNGMAIRLAFALSTFIEADILLIDEVIGAGDASFMDKAQKRLEEIINNSNILILSTHANDIIRKFCNLGLWLEKGSIKMFGKVEDVLAAYEENHCLV